ncbi:VacJ family lipoprotein [Acinetobacter sp. MB5]|uniref:MlaA family lipoprotein n=1 Tax=Acinetobacter sp. MB5 TaxID=2069438 RepID=UPI000DD039B4|nr:VacJ family lipoprotein [Acinetobacter sp. MB5]
MRQFSVLWVSLLTLGISSSVLANEATTTDVSSNQAESVNNKTSRLNELKRFSKKTIQDLKVDANAAQPDEVKDPFQPLNRKIFVFNDYIDRHVIRPIAVQYREKIPAEVRGSYRGFRGNLAEPWNATNQIIQWKPKRALKTVGRFLINSITTLGLADPASRLGLDPEEENFGTTLGYYGVPSGPYLMIPFLGPSTLRDGFGFIVDSQASPQKYILEENYPGLYWGDWALYAIDLRSSLLDFDSNVQGDRYAAIRDAYLQRKRFVISEKKGTANDVSFVDDSSSNDGTDSSSPADSGSTDK